jgi:hypothetical protein
MNTPINQLYEIYAVLGYYATSSVNTLSTFRDNISAPSFLNFLTLEDGTDTLSRNVDAA